MSALVALVTLAVGLAQEETPTARMIPMFEPEGTPSRLTIRINDVPLEPPKAAPRKFGPNNDQTWEFPWIVSGFGREPVGDEEGHQLRVRVFSQDRRAENDPAVLTARMATRMWDYLAREMGLGHPMSYNRGIVDFYLAWGGTPGGEHMFGEDTEAGIIRRVNTIYIYQLQSFTDTMEMAREVAHEYGHATLPAVGGYSEPEDWANGYLGEGIYLRYLLRDMKTGRLFPRDTMGATAEQIEAWLTKHVDPKMQAFANRGPNPAPLRARNRAGMDAYLGAVWYAHALLPPRVIGRALLLTGSQKGEDVLKGIERAAQEPEQLTITVPPSLDGRRLWIPTSGGTVSGATVVRRSSNGKWSLVQPTKGKPISVRNVVPSGAENR